MSIASEITRLDGAKTSIKNAIEAKGVTVPIETKLDQYGTYVAQITGGGGEPDWAPHPEWQNIENPTAGQTWMIFASNGALGYTVPRLFSSYTGTVDYGDGTIKTGSGVLLYEHTYTEGTGTLINAGTPDEYETWVIKIIGINRICEIQTSQGLLNVKYIVSNYDLIFFNLSYNNSIECVKFLNRVDYLYISSLSIKDIYMNSISQTSFPNTYSIYCPNLLKFHAPNCYKSGGSFTFYSSKVRYFKTKLFDMQTQDELIPVTYLGTSGTTIIPIKTLHIPLWTIDNFHLLNSKNIVLTYIPINISTSENNIVENITLLGDISASGYIRNFRNLKTITISNYTNLTSSISYNYDIVNEYVNTVNLPNVQKATSTYRCPVKFQNCSALVEINNTAYLGSSVPSGTTTDFYPFYSGCPNLRSDIIMTNRVNRYLGIGSASQICKVTSVVFLYTGTDGFTGSSPQIDIAYNSLDADALNLLFTFLPTMTGKTIKITGNVGTATCDKTIATSKGWTVTT